jgi:eukaryotic-like serine/threonine-protein kinase
MTDPQQIIAGKYHLLRRLGKGGMAEVYLAKQSGLDGFEKLVVIKKILPHLSGSAEFSKMFLGEARTAADLRHPNVVNIFEVGEDEGTYYMAMEFLHGQDIRRVQRQCHRVGTNVPLPHALQMILDAANGLHYAHNKTDIYNQQLQIIHRDISPQNIIVTYDGSTKIVDFGIAKATSQTTETATGVVKGKYTYMSPEQAGGHVLDQRTDQYALGIVLWELLTQRRLFKRESDILTLTAITEGDVPSPRQYADIPKTLEKIVLKALARERNARFADCHEFMMAMEDFLASERIVHSPARLGAYLRELFEEERSNEPSLSSVAIARVDIPERSNIEKTKAERKSRSGASERALTDADKAPVTVEDADLLSNAPTNVSPMVNRDGETPVTLQDHGMMGLGSDPTQSMGTAGTGMQQSGGGRRAAVLGIIGFFALVTCVSAGVILTEFLRKEPTGELILRTSPSNAAIYVNGTLRPQRTPSVLREIPVGSTQLIRYELEGYKPHEIQAVVKAKGIPTTVETDLIPQREAKGRSADTDRDENQTQPTRTKEPDKNNGATQDARATGDPAPRTTERPPSQTTRTPAKKKVNQAKKKTARSTAKFGTLRVVVKPWAKVYLDGKYLDETPFPPVRVKAGKHTVRLVNPDLKKDVKRRIFLKAGQDLKIAESWTD